MQKMKPNELRMTPLPHDRFIRQGSELVAEVSDFDLPHDGLYQRIYNDACDVGIAIEGKRRVVRFAFVDHIPNGHRHACLATCRMATGGCALKEGGEICGWRFTPIDDSNGITQVVIIND